MLGLLTLGIANRKLVNNVKEAIPPFFLGENICKEIYFSYFLSQSAVTISVVDIYTSLTKRKERKKRKGEKYAVMTVGCMDSIFPLWEGYSQTDPRWLRTDWIVSV